MKKAAKRKKAAAPRRKKIAAKARKKAKPRKATKPRKVAAKKRTAAKARKATKPRTKAKPRASSPRLRVVRPRRARTAQHASAGAAGSNVAKPASPPSFPQREGASPRQLSLFELLRARASFLSAVQGLTPGPANDPIAPGKWCPREIVLHLVTRDLARLREMEAALRGVAPSWKGTEEARWATINEEALAPLRRHDWDEALRLMHRTRQELLEAIESVPEEPADVWSPEHAFGWMLQGLPPHDRHHADQIKRWRATRGA